MAVPSLAIRLNFARKKAFEDYAIGLAPVLYLRCGESAGSWAWDRVGGHHASINGTCTLGADGLLTEDPGTALTLDGSTGYLKVADHADLDLGDTFWFAAIIKRTATGAQIIADKGTGGWSVGFDAGHHVYLAKTGTATIVSSTSHVTNTAAHLVIVRKVAAITTLLVDGVDVTGAITDQTIGNTATDLYIGANAAADSFLDATVQEVAYGAALTDAQAFGLYVAFAQGEYGGPFDDIAAGGYVQPPVKIRDGANAEFTGEITGTMTLECSNTNGFFTSARNLCDNPSFSSGLDGWQIAAATGLTSAATSMTPVADSPATGCAWSAEVTLPATSGAGVAYPLAGTYYAGVPYSFAGALKKISGTTAIDVGIASAATVADIAVSGSTITTSWVRYGETWIPATTCSDAVLFVRSTEASAAVVRIGAFQINAGTTVKPFLEGPTRAMLRGGTPVHAYYTYSGSNGALFHGTLTRPYPVPEGMGCTLTVMDDSVTLAKGMVTLQNRYGRSHREYRADIIDAAIRNIEGGYRNLCYNGGFEVDLTGWALSSGYSGTITRSTAVYHSGVASLKMVGDGSGSLPSVEFTDASQTFMAGQLYRADLWLEAIGSPGYIIVEFGQTLSWKTLLTESQYVISVKGPTPAYTDTGDPWILYGPLGQRGGSDFATEQSIPATSLTTFASNGAQLRLGTGGTAALPSAVTFERYTVLFRNPSDTTAMKLRVQTGSNNAANGVYIADVMISAGPLRRDYIGVGSPVGRQPNAISNATFATDRAGWEWGYHNRILNASGDGSGTGWAVTTDAFITDDTGSLADGGTAFVLTAADAGEGCHYDLADTFYSGHAYRVSVCCVATNGNFHVGIGSQGTPADKAVAVSMAGATTHTLTWTPTGDRTDAHFYIKKDDGTAAKTCTFNLAFVAPYRVTAPTAVEDGIATLDEPASLTRVTNDAQATGGTCAELVTYAAAGSGTLIPLGFDAQPLGYAGQTLTASMEVWATAGTPSVQLGMGSPASGTDTATATFVVSTTKRRYVWSWTPSANRTDPIAWIAAGAAAAITVRFGAVQTNVGKAVQPFEMPQLSGLDSAETWIAPQVSSSQTSASPLLSEISGQNLTRHWVEATLQRPWWRYCTSALVSESAKAVSETIDEDMEEMTGFEVEDGSVGNVVTVEYAPSGYIVDAGYSISNTAVMVIQSIDEASASPDRYGLRQRTAGGRLINPPVGGDTSAQTIADAIRDRYAYPRAHPEIILVNRFASLGRKLDDLIAVNFARQGVYGGRYLIMSRELTISEGRQRWDMTWMLEEVG